jgi:exodeoxyribonuclease VIII
MAKHLMVDLETCGTTPDTVILTLGAVHFDPWDSGVTDQIYLKLDLDDQDKLGRKIDAKTIEWWSTQDPAVMEEAFSEDGRIPFADALEQFRKFAWGCDAFWSHGSIFDLVILENALFQIGKPLPWQFWQIRDTRTLFDLGHSHDMPKANKHNAIEDAIRQVVGVQNVYKKLNVQKK